MPPIAAAANVEVDWAPPPILLLTTLVLVGGATPLIFLLDIAGGRMDKHHFVFQIHALS